MGMGRLDSCLTSTVNQNDKLIKCTQRVFGYETKEDALLSFKYSLDKHGIPYTESWKFSIRKYNANFSDSYSDEYYYFCKVIPSE